VGIARLIEVTEIVNQLTELVRLMKLLHDQTNSVRQLTELVCVPWRHGLVVLDGLQLQALLHQRLSSFIWVRLS
jgi:hypothetical protein